MATHSSTLAWKILWTESLMALPAVHGVAKSPTRLSDFTFTFTRILTCDENVKYSDTLPIQQPPNAGQKTYMEDPSEL